MHFTRVFIACGNLPSERESEAQGLILCLARPFGAEYSRACPGKSQPAHYEQCSPGLPSGWP